MLNVWHTCWTPRRPTRASPHRLATVETSYSFYAPLERTTIVAIFYRLQKGVSENIFILADRIKLRGMARWIDRKNVRLSCIHFKTVKKFLVF